VGDFDPYPGGIFMTQNVHTVLAATTDNFHAVLLLGGLIFIFFVGPVLAFTFGPRFAARRRLKAIPHTVTEGELRTQKAMEAALRNTQQYQPPATQQYQPPPPASLSSRLTQLDEALRAGLITQQDYDKKRADIIASA
jgi:hypothetical protein